MYNINKYKLLIILAASVLLNACSDSTSALEEEVLSEIDINTVENLYAPFDRNDPQNSPFVYFNLRTGETVDAEQADSQNWDIAFRGTSVIINSGDSGPGAAGALILDVEFDEVSIAPTEGYRQDHADEPAITGNGGWYTYTGTQGNPAHAILAHDDTTIIMKTADGNHYVKLHIMSYYKGNPDYDTEEFVNLRTRPASQHYTFRYAIQMAEGLRDLK